MTRWRLLLLTALLRAPSFARPFLSDDEGTYAAIGRAVRHGARLYVDAVDHKPPLLYWWYAAAYWLAGDAVAMYAIHAVLIVVVWATALVLGAIAKRATPEESAVGGVTAALYIVFTTAMMSFDSLAANGELLLMLPASLSLLAALDARRSTTLFIAGWWLAVATGFKYQAAAQLPVLLLLAVAGTSAWPARLRRSAAALAGFVVPWAALAALLWARGTLREALYVFSFNFSYIGAGTQPGELWQRALPRLALAVLPAILLYGAAAAGAWRAVTTGTSRGRAIVLWALVSLAAVSVGGRFFGHYFHQAIGPLAVLAAPVVIDLWRRLPALTGVALAGPAFVFWIVAWAHPFVMRDIVHHPDPDYASVVVALDRRAPRTESLCVWGNSPELVARALRPLGCRFVFANYLTGLSPATRTQTDPSVDASANIAPGMWPRFLSDLAEKRPTFIVDGSPGNVGYYGKFPPERYAAFWSVLSRDYVVVDTVQGMRIFRRLEAKRPRS